MDVLPSTAILPISRWPWSRIAFTRNLHLFSVKQIFSERLIEARKLRGVSQRQLGLEIGLGKATGGVRINRYERQSSTPTILVAGAIAAALDIPVAYLFAISHDMAQSILEHRDAKMKNGLATD